MEDFLRVSIVSKKLEDDYHKVNRIGTRKRKIKNDLGSSISFYVRVASAPRNRHELTPQHASCFAVRRGVFPL